LLRVIFKMSGSAKKNELLAADFFKVTNSTNKENMNSNIPKQPASNVINNNPTRNLFGDITRNVNHQSDNRQNFLNSSLLGSASKTPVQFNSTAKNITSQFNNKTHFASNFNKLVQDQFAKAFEADDENVENVGLSSSSSSSSSVAAAAAAAEGNQTSDKPVPGIQLHRSLPSLSESGLSPLISTTMITPAINISNVELTTSLMVIPSVANVNVVLETAALNVPSASSANGSPPTMEIDTTSTMTRGKLHLRLKF
jgi:hypothetical protein